MPPRLFVSNLLRFFDGFAQAFKVHSGSAHQKRPAWSNPNRSLFNNHVAANQTLAKNSHRAEARLSWCFDYSSPSLRDQPVICLFPSSANLSKVAFTSKSAGALNEQDFSETSVSISAIPSTLLRALRTEAAQPPHVMPGSFNATV